MWVPYAFKQFKCLSELFCCCRKWCINWPFRPTFVVPCLMKDICYDWCSFLLFFCRSCSYTLQSLLLHIHSLSDLQQDPQLCWLNENSCILLIINYESQTKTIFTLCVLGLKSKCALGKMCALLLIYLVSFACYMQVVLTMSTLGCVVVI